MVIAMKEKVKLKSNVLTRQSSLFVLLFVLSSSAVSAQMNVKDGALFLKPLFAINDTVFYKVRSHTKVDSSPLFPINCSREFTVSFIVSDTVNGHRLVMQISTDTIFHSHMESEAIKAWVVDGLTVILTLSPEGKSISIENVDDVRDRLNEALDYYTFEKKLDRTSDALIREIRILLHDYKGVFALLDPFLIPFDSYGNLFRKQKDYKAASKRNLAGTEPFPGVITTQLLKNKKGQANDEASVSLTYIGNRDQAAKILRPVQKALLDQATGRSVDDSNFPSSARMDTNHKLIFDMKSGWWRSLESKSIHFYLTKVIYTIEFKQVPRQ